MWSLSSFKVGGVPTGRKGFHILGSPIKRLGFAPGGSYGCFDFRDMETRSETGSSLLKAAQLPSGSAGLTPRPDPRA